MSNRNHTIFADTMIRTQPIDPYYINQLKKAKREFNKLFPTVFCVFHTNTITLHTTKGNVINFNISEFNYLKITFSFSKNTNPYPTGYLTVQRKITDFKDLNQAITIKECLLDKKSLIDIHIKDEINELKKRNVTINVLIDNDIK
jgi:hypothetical protein